MKETFAPTMNGSKPGHMRSLRDWLLPGFSGKRSSRRKRNAVAGTREQMEALVDICRTAGWSPAVLANDAASSNLHRALLREIRACADAGEHRLVVRLLRKAAGLGIQHPQLRRARRQAQALIDAGLNTQLETAIQLRTEGHPSASLALLDAAAAAGLSSPWIHDNRARPLVDLGQRADALRLWSQLSKADDHAVRQAAQEMVLRLGLEADHERDQFIAKLALLETKAKQTSQQLDVFQDLFTQLTLEP